MTHGHIRQVVWDHFLGAAESLLPLLARSDWRPGRLGDALSTRARRVVLFVFVFARGSASAARCFQRAEFSHRSSILFLAFVSLSKGRCCQWRCLEFALSGRKGIIFPLVGQKGWLSPWV